MTNALEQVKVIDADTHLTERHDLWTSRAPAKWKDRVPHVAKVDGAATWVVDGVVLGRAGAGGVIDRDGNKGRSFEGLYEWEIEQAHVAAYDPLDDGPLVHPRGIDGGDHHLEIPVPPQARIAERDPRLGPTRASSVAG